MAACRDIIIVGGGIAGMTAAIYAARANMDVLLLEKDTCGGLANETRAVENFPSYSTIGGMELMERIRDQVIGLGVVIEEINRVDGLITEGLKRVMTEEGEVEARAVILSTGRKPIPLPVGTEWQENIHYCSVCDGLLYQGKDVIVVGGGNSGFDESLYLAELGVRSIQILEMMDRFPADETTRRKANAAGVIKTRTGCRIIDVQPTGNRGEVIVENLKSGKTETVFIDGIFVFIGQKPNTGFLAGNIRLDDNGYVLVDQRMRTNVPGVFAAGDVVTKEYRQLTTAMSDGTVAALEACQYVREWKKDHV